MERKKTIVLAILFGIPAVLSIYVPIYNIEGKLFEIPFFYGFQILLLAVASAFYLTYSFLIDHKAAKK